MQADAAQAHLRLELSSQARASDTIDHGSRPFDQHEDADNREHGILNNGNVSPQHAVDQVIPLRLVRRREVGN